MGSVRTQLGPGEVAATYASEEDATHPTRRVLTPTRSRTIGSRGVNLGGVRARTATR